MVKRWMIRGVLVLLLVVCVGGWGWSVGRVSTLVLPSPRSWVVAVDSGEGIAYVNFHYDPDEVFVRRPWFTWDEYVASITKYERLGLLHIRPCTWMIYPSRWEWGSFSYTGGPVSSNAGTSAYHRLGVPYWFLMVILSMMLGYVWRKTRSKVTKGGAFPVITTGGQV